MTRTRIFFTTDVHGSEHCWRKFLNATKFYKEINVAILGGDTTGKVIVPIVEQGDGSWWATFNKEYHMKSEKEVEEVEKIIRFCGSYPLRTTPDVVEELENNKDALSELFNKLIVSEFERWMSLVEDRVPEDVKVIVNPGNDDSFLVDDVIRNNERVIYPLDDVVYLDDTHPMISLEYVNPTPWRSPRECSEEELRKKIDKLFAMVDTNDYRKLVCNFHAPPYQTKLDDAPKLTEELKPVRVAGHQVTIPVGSTAVREALLENKPLLGLHGHIHESAGAVTLGETHCVNPGSEYGEGILRGYIIDLTKDGIEKFWGTRG
jgi:Icc-related predicted phosphoesterase